jgi:hypothetical protein
LPCMARQPLAMTGMLRRGIALLGVGARLMLRILPSMLCFFPVARILGGRTVMDPLWVRFFERMLGGQIGR